MQRVDNYFFLAQSHIDRDKNDRTKFIWHCLFLDLCQTSRRIIY